MTTRRLTRDQLVGGIVLIVIGLVALVMQFVDMESVGVYVLPALAIIFLVWGLVARQIGPIIPGGILAGLGIGTLLIAGPWQLPADVDEGGVFLLAFALGWVLITILSVFVSEKVHWWPLIPGVILGIVGFAILYGGIFDDVLASLAYVGPAILILIGLYLLLRPRPRPTQ
ncbi:MAG: hypothetical protein KC418_12255 [Anaerolineales bacterium]|nr:hypothetical protein [Anaerolineales bacterium]MCB8951550.1 hypothetical protein [Ardenticatenales bacterium]